jgi:hypothetical protein
MGWIVLIVTAGATACLTFMLHEARIFLTLTSLSPCLTINLAIFTARTA